MAEQSIAEVVAHAREAAEAANSLALRDEVDRLRTAITRLTEDRDEARSLLRRVLEHDDVAFGGYARDLRVEIDAALNKDTANG